MSQFTALPFVKGNPIWMASKRMSYGNSVFSGKIDVHPVLVRDTLYKLPFSLVPQVAFVGRSNVGKSSLINSLVHGREIARPSPMPGRTRQLFTFDIGNIISLVDLPGYGFAGKVSRTEQAEWLEMIKLYLANANGLERIVSLVDARHGVKKLDEDFWKVIAESKIHPKRKLKPMVVVTLTKADLLTSFELERTIKAIIPIMEHFKRTEDLRLWPYLHAVSAETGYGVKELRSALAYICPFPTEVTGDRINATDRI
jgi:ribosome biogenesis GTP-binding protein YsxC/EngB